ncbi:exodeoxyribonuclease III [Neisseria lisongii]|uniref:Exodeoxyribonuclease III n=1 Tax=Neisseria lisongii TaxID=2912188 RepID=A0AAW5AIA3_9NEIS|nr:exodeoxyribonuclease III [Neisseria lisongii]MCF7529827.1 exodeoxyribonuclease III [Neisseria lisongii]
MKITTWNVNSLNVRLPHVQNFLADGRTDILVLQELKLDQDKFPAAALNIMGWQTVWSGQKTYNGVAVISRSQAQDVHTGLPLMPDDPQRRVIAATIDGVRIINVYCVNGEALDSPKFAYKREWFAALTAFVRDEMSRHDKLVLLGDFNIAPADADCYDPEKWHEKIHCSSEERSWFQALLDLGLTDSLRQIHPEGAFYTWFDYRGAMFQRKQGLRIDHLLITPTLAAVLENVEVELDMRALERPSDHAPVTATFAD